MTKKILAILGHPRPESLCGALTEAYLSGAAAAGAQTQALRISDLQFDLSAPADFQAKGLEPDLEKVQNALRWADHIALAYPNWWGGAPGQLRTMFEHVLMPGFAFKYQAKGLGWDRLLKGRTGELLVTMDTPPFFYKWFYGAAGDKIMAGRTLDFCGIKPVRTTHFGPVRKSSPEIRQQWLAKANALGKASA